MFKTIVTASSTGVNGPAMFTIITSILDNKIKMQSNLM